MMPSEPDKKMEELLRTYARKRREDAGEAPEMHPATRRLLQAEAARLRPPEAKPERRTLWSWLLLRWPRVAFAVGLFAVLAIVVWNGIPDRSQSTAPTLLAKQDKQEKAMFEAPPPARDGIAPAEAQVGARFEQNKDFAKSSEPAALSARPLSEDRARGFLGDAGELSDSKRKQAPQPPARALSLQPAPTDELKLAEAEAAGAKLEKPVLTRKLDGATSVPRFVEDQVAFRRESTVTNAVSGGAILAQKPATDATASKVGSYTAPATPNANTSAVLAYDTEKNAPKASLADREYGAASASAAARPQARARGAGVATSGLVVAKATIPPSAQPRQFFRFIRQTEARESAEANKAKETASDSVLVTFDLEQDGDRVLVTDADGSVYAGRYVTGAELGQLGAVVLGEELNRPAPTGPTPLRQSNTEGARRFTAVLPTTNRVFRVNGTNRTIGQFVTFEALVSGSPEAVINGDAYRLAPTSTPPPAPPSTPVTAESRSKVPAATKASGALVPAGALESQRLVGRLRIGGSNEVMLRAVPVSAAK